MNIEQRVDDLLQGWSDIVEPGLLRQVVLGFGRECWNAAIEEAARTVTETGDPPVSKVWLVAADNIRAKKFKCRLTH